jgi:hypothetical protein
MQIYLKNSIIFDSFTQVEFLNINISPLIDNDGNAEKIPFKV